MLQEIGKNHPIDIEKLKKEIIDRLKPLNPCKIILFGSYAYGTPTKDSDIDLYIVTNDEFMPKSWREKITIYLQCRQIRGNNKKIPYRSYCAYQENA